MYAVIETGGKQYRVEVGTELAVELLDAAPGDSITLDRVLLVADGDATSVGRPVVDGASVAAEVVRFDRADKVVAFKYRPKARRRVKKGHRQDQTILRITDVVVDGRSAAEEARRAEADAKTERERVEEAAARQAAEDAALAATLAARSKPAAGTETSEPAPKRRRAKAAAGAETPADAETSSGEAETGTSEAAPKRSRTRTKKTEEPAPEAEAAGTTETSAQESEADAMPEADESAEAPDASPPTRSRRKKDE